MVLLIGVNAALVALEVALAAVDPSAVRSGADGDDRGDRLRDGSVAALLDRRGAVVSSAQLGITICSIGLGVLAVAAVAPVLQDLAANWVEPAGVLWWAAAAVGVLVTIVAQLAVGELLPATFATARPELVTTALARPARVMAMVVGPVVGVLVRCSRRIAAGLGVIDAPAESEVRSREELRRLVRDSEAEGTISHQDAVLLQRTLRMGDKVAADALTPRVELTWLPSDSKVSDLVERSAATGLSRFPVVGDGLDDIVGVVHVKDVLGVPRARRAETPLAELVRPVLAVPESKPLEELMVLLKSETGQFALVVDEYGGTAGIITLEDLLEEIVGEIDDEHDPARRGLSVRRWAGAHLLSGRLHPDDVGDACGFDLPEGDYETLGGFMMDRLAAIPSVGDRVEVDGWSLEVLSMDGRRVETVRVVAPAPGTIGGGA